MKEQEQRPLGELHRKLNRVNRALVKVDTVSQTIGTSAFEGHSNLNERFDLSKLQGEPFLDAAVKVGLVKEALEDRAKPTLLFQKEKVEREIENFDRVDRARKRVEQIRGFVQRGLLLESVLENAQRALADLTQGFTPPSISADEPRPVIVGRRGRNRIEARPSGVFGIVLGIAAGAVEEKPFVFPNGQKVYSLTEHEIKIVSKLLDTSKEKPISSSEWARSIYGEELPIRVGKNRLSTKMTTIRRLLDSVGWEIVNLTPAKDRLEGREAKYYLAQKEIKDAIEESPTEEKEKIVAERDLQEIETSLPDGQFIKVKGRKTAQVLEELTQTSKENQIATDELAQVLFGSGDRSSISKTYQIVKRVQSQLESLNWRIVKVGGGHAERKRGEKMKYYLENVVEEKEKTIDASEKVMPTVDPTTPQEPKPEEIPIVAVGPVDAKGTTGVFVEIPYEPTEKEKRTEKETKILDVIISSLLATTRMRFEEIQRQLYSKDRAKPLVGGEAIFIYQSQELVENLNSAFSKIREEAEIDTLRENWDDKEKEMWKKLELLRTKFQVTEVRDFLRRVSEEIKRSERQFYIDYPPESGNRVTWIRKDK